MLFLFLLLKHVRRPFIYLRFNECIYFWAQVLVSLYRYYFAKIWMSTDPLIHEIMKSHIFEITYVVQKGVLIIEGCDWLTTEWVEFSNEFLYNANCRNNLKKLQMLSWKKTSLAAHHTFVCATSRFCSRLNVCRRFQSIYIRTLNSHFLTH